MPAYEVAKALREYATWPYRKLWTNWKIADAELRLDAPYLRQSLQGREDPMHVGFLAIARDAIRKTEGQMYCFRGGHWRAVVLKIKAQKPDKDRIRLYLMGGGFVATVIGFFYGVYYLRS